MSSHHDIPSLDELQSLSVQTLSRRDIRSLLFHLLYAMEAYEYEVPLESIIDTFNRGYNLDIKRDSEIGCMTAGIIAEREALDTLIKPLLHNWRFDRLSVCTKLILRMALWELQHTQTAPNIIINEAIELAKCFAEDDAFKFVNGILDEYVKSVGRSSESSE